MFPDGFNVFSPRFLCPSFKTRLLIEQGDTAGVVKRLLIDRLLLLFPRELFPTSSSYVKISMSNLKRHVNKLAASNLHVSFDEYEGYHFQKMLSHISSTDKVFLQYASLYGF